MRAVLKIARATRQSDYMRPRDPAGQYRTEPGEHRSPMVYVIGGGSPSYMTEAMYRAKGLNPPFEELPTEAEYDA